MDTSLLDELETQHREAEQLLEQLGDTDDPDEQRTLVEQLVSAMDQHMEIEETQVYPELQKLDGEMGEEARIEHDLARAGLDQLTEMIGLPGFGAAVAMVEAGIAHHVDEEENEAFPKLRQAIDSGSSGVHDEPSKAELYELAKEQDIEGRSTMSKEELRDAVQR